MANTMEFIENNRFGLTNNKLKIIAMISMLIDHIGVALFPYVEIFRIIGRLAFPIFAYMIAEGCRYTKNRKKYLGIILGMAIVFQLVYFFALDDLYQGILVTFSLAIMSIYAIDGILHSKSIIYRIAMVGVLCIVIFVGIICPEIFRRYGFDIDYGVWGITLPVLVYFAPNKKARLVLITIFFALMAIIASPLQWWSLLTIPLFALYNGKRGKANLKYLFYIFYPLHLVLIYGVAILIALLK